MTERPIQHLVTHSGTFHADDACAYAILSDLYPQATLTRTRNDKEIEEKGKEGIVFDVGRRYAPEEGRFDHHQPGAPVRENGLAYAAFGLVWKHHGQEWLVQAAGVPQSVVPAVHAQMAEKFVQDVDRVDVGAIKADYPLSASLPGIIHAMNPARFGLDGQTLSPSEGEVESRFNQAAQLARRVITDQAHTLAREQVAAAIINQEGEKRANGRILVLEKSLPWEAAVVERPEHAGVLLVLTPDSIAGQWGVNCARKDLNTFESRRLLPKEWSGHVNEQLEEASGIKGAKFCHSAGFYAALTGKDAALAFAERATQIWDREDRMIRITAKAQELGPQKEAEKPHQPKIARSTKTKSERD